MLVFSDAVSCKRSNKRSVR